MLVASSRSPSLNMWQSYSGAGATSIRDRVRRAAVMLPAPKSSPPDRETLVCALALVALGAGVAKLLDGGMDELTGVCRPRACDDLPLAGLVGETVSDLEVCREDVVGQTHDLLLPWVLGGDAGGWPPQGGPERVECGFGLSDQHVRVVSQLLTLLDQVACRVARLLRPASHFRRQHSVAVKMRPNRVGQVCVTPWARV